MGEVTDQVTTATIVTTPKNTTPTTFQSISGFAVPSVIHNNQSLLWVSYFWNFRHRLAWYYWYFYHRMRWFNPPKKEVVKSIYIAFNESLSIHAEIIWNPFLAQQTSPLMLSDFKHVGRIAWSAWSRSFARIHCKQCLGWFGDGDGSIEPWGNTLVDNHYLWNNN